MAKGAWKPAKIVDGKRVPKHNETNKGGQKVRLLDMRRQKYFRFDLEDLMEEFKLGDKSNTFSATIQNKMTTQSYDDALEYVDRNVDSLDLTEAQIDKLKNLLRRYTKWR